MDIVISIDDKNGTVSGRYLINDSCTHLLLLAHGAGAGMQHPFMEGLANALLSRNIGTLRFNFPYMEKGKRRPDGKSTTTLTLSRAVEQALDLSELPIVVAGKSFGGRMASHLVVGNPTLPIKALVFYGFPLHPSGKPSIDRAAHLKEIEIPMLFLQGTRDSLAQLDLLTPLLKNLPPAQLRVLDGADHGFKFLKKLGIDQEAMFQLLAHHTQEFLKDIH